MARADLKLQSTSQLFKQAAFSFKASIWVFLSIALLSSVYETGIERATDLSGFSLNFNDTRLSVDFDFHLKSLFPIHSDDEVNGAKQGGVDSLLGRFLSAIFAPASTINGTSAGLAQKEYSQAEKDRSVEAAGQQIGLSERGDQVIDNIGEKSKQSNEIEKVQNEKPNESDANAYVKPNEPETTDKLPAESEYAAFENIIQENPSEDSKDLDESDMTPNENLNHIEVDSGTAHKRSSNKQGITQDENNAELENEPDSAGDLDGNALEDGGEVIGSPLVGSLKIVHRFGNESKKQIAKKLLKQKARTSSSTGIFDQGTIPPGAEKTLALVLSIILLVSFVVLLVVTFQVAFVLRVVAFTVTSTHVGKKASIKQSLRSSLRSGIWKLMWFAIFIGFLQELQTQFMAKIFLERPWRRIRLKNWYIGCQSCPFLSWLHGRMIWRLAWVCFYG